MENIIDQVKQIATEADVITRKRLKVLLRDLLYSLEDDDDIVQRIGYLPLQSSAVRTGIDLKLFELLSTSENPYGATDLANATGADPLFLGRYLRYLASGGYIQETGKDEFTANHTTRALAIPGNQAGLCHIFETCGPQYQEMPRFLRKIQYGDITDHHNTVFQDAWNTRQGAFEWFAEHPRELEYFNNYMASRRQSGRTWLSVYPVEEETRDWNPEKPVYVNIGGSIGHQCAEFKTTYPQVLGQVILQDLNHSIGNALQTPGVQNMVHNFFEPQPVRGAKFYFLRGVLHNHPDDRVCTILQHTKNAMSQDSVLLIDEMVLPDTGLELNVAAIDLTMMCAAASRERTKSQWQNLLESVGLEVQKSLVYNPAMYETVMAVVRKKAKV